MSMMSKIAYLVEDWQVECEDVIHEAYFWINGDDRLDFGERVVDLLLDGIEGIEYPENISDLLELVEEFDIWKVVMYEIMHYMGNQALEEFGEEFFRLRNIPLENAVF